MLKSILVLPDGTELSSGTPSGNAIKSVNITQSVNNGSELAPGSVCAGILELTAFTPGGDLTLNVGDEVTLYKVDDAGTRTKIGVYILEKPTRPTANTVKLTGYDRVVWLDKDLTEWLRGLTGWPYNLLDFAGKVCGACGLRMATRSIPNGTYPVHRFSKAGVTGRQLLAWCGEICCRFCRADANGNMEFAWYTPSGKTITPGGDPRYFANSLTYDTYTVEPVDGVQIRLTDSGNGAVWPAAGAVFGTMTNASYDYLNIRSGPGFNYGSVGKLMYGARAQILEQKTVSGNLWGRVPEGWICITGYVTLETVTAANPYIITGNAILLAHVTADTLPYLQVIGGELSGLAYTPCKVTIPATLEIRAGQTVEIRDQNGKTITGCVMTKTTKGQKDTLSCTGSRRRDSTSAVNTKSPADIAAEKAWQAVDGMTQQQVFDKLTDHGLIQGIYVQDGKWYINAELVKVINLIAEHVISEATVDGRKQRMEIDSSSLSYSVDGNSAMSLGVSAEGYLQILMPVYDRNTKAQLGDAMISPNMIGMVGLVGSPGRAWLAFDKDAGGQLAVDVINDKKVSWKYNSAMGGYVLVGT